MTQVTAGKIAEKFADHIDNMLWEAYCNGKNLRHMYKRESQRGHDAPTFVKAEAERLIRLGVAKYLSLAKTLYPDNVPHYEDFQQWLGETYRNTMRTSYLETIEKPPSMM